MEPAHLKRTITAPSLAFYGIGTMLGAGVFALIGEVVSEAGAFAPLSFLLAACVAALTAMSFAELSSRYPKAAGAATYTAAAFKSPSLQIMVGLLMVGAGIVSAGVMTRSFIGYAGEFLYIPMIPGVLVLTVVMTAIAALGVVLSVTIVVVITLLEAGLLLLIIFLGFQTPTAAETAMVSTSPAVGGILAGGVLAFYAFLGFEDMVNMAEEVKKPRRSLPLAILVALMTTATIYIAIAWVAVTMVPIDELSKSAAPMALIFSRVSTMPPQFISVIAMIAVINGALVQILMASRILYGLADQKRLPAWFGVINPRTRTPVRATICIAIAIFLAASALPLAALAEATTLIILIVFTIVNISLIRVKKSDQRNEAIFKIPITLPYAGAIATSILVVISLVSIFF